MASRLFLAGWTVVAAVVMPLLFVVVPMVMSRLPEAQSGELSSGFDRS